MPDLARRRSLQQLERAERTIRSVRRPSGSRAPVPGGRPPLFDALRAAA